MIGLGHWGPHIARNIRNSNLAWLAWIADSDEARLESVADRFEDVRSTTDAGDVFGDSDVDAVIIATPTATHFDLAKAALAAGKHVMVEKPLAHSVDAADELCRLADQQGRTLMVGHVFLFNGAVLAGEALVNEGRLGKIHYLSMRRTNLGPIRSDVNAAWDLAAHDISIANYLLKARPTAVSAVGAGWLRDDNEDAVFLNLRYPGKVLVHIEVSWLNPRKERQVTIVGDRAMLTLDDMDLNEPLRIYDKGVDTPTDVTDTFAGFRGQIRDGTVTIPKVAIAEPLNSECEYFLGCVTNGTAPEEGRCDGPSGRAVVAVLEAADASLLGSGAFVGVDQG